MILAVRSDLSEMRAIATGLPGWHSVGMVRKTNMGRSKAGSRPVRHHLSSMKSDVSYLSPVRHHYWHHRHPETAYAYGALQRKRSLCVLGDTAYMEDHEDYPRLLRSVSMRASLLGTT